MMSEQLPPVEFVVDEKQRRFRGLQGQNNNKFNNPSVRSFASSITFGSESEFTDDQSDLDPFLDAHLPQNDHLPGKPQRRGTLPLASLSEAVAAADATPCRPFRQQSEAFALTVNEQNVEAAAAAAGDAAPCLPSRQVSVAASSQKSSEKQLSERSSSTTSSAEPVPEYLQPTVCQDFESKLKEMTDQAELFKQGVDIQDRKYGLRSYKQCFVGSEAVDQIVEAGLAETREEAVELGNSWMKYLNLFQHVCDHHEFKDKHLFYKFNDFESKLKELTAKAELFKRVVDIQDRKYSLRSYKQCFIGSEAIDRILEAGLAKTREEAVELGNSWMKYLNLFQHVCDNHDFKDKHLFYKFRATATASSNKTGRKWGSSNSSSKPWYSTQDRETTTIMEDHPMSQTEMDHNPFL